MINNNYDCHVNDKKATRVAEDLISDWTAAALVSNYKGAKFLAAIQPIFWTSETDSNDLKKSKYTLDDG